MTTDENERWQRRREAQMTMEQKLAWLDSAWELVGMLRQGQPSTGARLDNLPHGMPVYPMTPPTNR